MRLAASWVSWTRPAIGPIPRRTGRAAGLTAKWPLAAGDLNAAQAAFVAAAPAGKMPFNRSDAATSFVDNDSPWRDGLARVKVARGDLAVAIQIYRSLLTPDIGSKFTSILEPRDVLALARLLDTSGDTAGARDHYRRFLDLWKHADPGQPELVEARRKSGQEPEPGDPEPIGGRRAAIR